MGESVHSAKSWAGAEEEGEDEEDEEDETERDAAGAKIGAHVKRKDGMEMEVTFVSGGQNQHIFLPPYHNSIP